MSVTLTYSKAEACSEPRHIHSPAIFRPPLYSQRWHIQNLRHIQNTVAHQRWSVNYFHGYKYFHKFQLFSQILPRWNKYLDVVCPEVIMLSKKLWREGAGDRDFFYIYIYTYLLIYWNKLAYLQLITVLVYRNNPPKSWTRGKTLKNTCEWIHF